MNNDNNLMFDEEECRVKLNIIQKQKFPLISSTNSFIRINKNDESKSFQFHSVTFETTEKVVLEKILQSVHDIDFGDEEMNKNFESVKNVLESVIKRTKKIKEEY